MTGICIPPLPSAYLVNLTDNVRILLNHIGYFRFSVSISSQEKPEPTASNCSD